MIQVQQIYDALCKIAPLEEAKPGDRVGLLVGRAQLEISRVLCALDITKDVIEEAIRFGARLIVAHHPVFFTLEGITGTSREGETVLRLAETGLAAICMHTNLDAAQGGVNETLATILGLRQITHFCADRCGRAGILDRPEDVLSFAARCKAALRCGVVRFYDAKRPVSRICVASGAGFSEFEEAYAWGADTFVCGEAKHSAFLDAAQAGINLLDCGHHATEAVVFQTLVPTLQEIFPSVEFRLSEQQGEPYRCI